MYRLKVSLLKHRIGNAVYRQWMARRGHPVHVPRHYIAQHVPGRSFFDVGGIWAINGAHSFAAEEAGAARVVLLDLERTKEFEEERERRGSRVEFVSGDATNQENLSRVGTFDVVWCFGVLYHVPDPFALIRSLRGVCHGTLLLETLTIPEVPGLPQAAIYFPMMPEWMRSMWDTRRRGSTATQHGLTSAYRPDVGYGNNFWGLSPSAVAALLRTSGFRVDDVAPSPHGKLRHVFTCRAEPWKDAFTPRGLPYDPAEPESRRSLPAR